jgi:hypothetical protein
MRIKARLRFKELKKLSGPVSARIINEMVNEIEELVQGDLSELDETKMLSSPQMRRQLHEAKRTAHVGSACAKFTDLEELADAYDPAVICLMKDEIDEHLGIGGKDYTALDLYDPKRTVDEMKKYFEEVIADAHISGARDVFDRLETMQEKLSALAVDRMVGRIYEHLREAGQDAAILDPESGNTADEIKERIEAHAQRIKDLSDPVKILRREWAAAVAKPDLPKMQRLFKDDPTIIDVPVNPAGETAMDVVATQSYEANKKQFTKEGKALAVVFEEALDFLKDKKARTQKQVQRDLQTPSTP